MLFLYTNIAYDYCFSEDTPVLANLATNILFSQGTTTLGEFSYAIWYIHEEWKTRWEINDYHNRRQ